MNKAINQMKLLRQAKELEIHDEYYVCGCINACGAQEWKTKHRDQVSRFLRRFLFDNVRHSECTP